MKSEDLMSDSGLQTLLKNAIGDLLKAQIDRKQYYVFVGETGAHIGAKNNFGLDVAVYDKALLLPEKITNKYIDVPPKLVVEIDVNVEMSDAEGNLFEQYIVPKIRQLFAFGTERVVWVFSKTQTIIYADDAQHWAFPKWDDEMSLLPGVTLNMARMIQEEGIHLDLIS